MKIRNLLIALSLLLVLSACSSGSNETGAAEAIESYLQALIAKDADSLIGHSCAAWEADARLEYDSLAAVTARLEDPDCKETGQDGDATLVACTGKIVANYNGEDQDLSLSARTYRTIQEGGEWRMCGYQ